LIDNCLNVDGDFHSYDSCNIHSHNVFNKNALRYLSLNVCGIKFKSKYPELRDLLDNYDIVCLTETKLDDIDVIECNDFTFKYVKFKSIVRPQIRVLSSNLCLPSKSKSYKITVPPNPCPFTAQICVLWNRFALNSVYSQIDFPSDLCPSLWQKNDVIIIAN
jgi:hypothetical protein